MAMISRMGFGQVEPNHLSAQRNGQVYGQLPCAVDIEVLENGQFVKYDYAHLDEEGNHAPECNFTGAGEWMLVLNEVKLYDTFWRESYKDYAMQKVNFDKGIMTPRVMKTMPGDIFTTNCIKNGNTSGKATVEGEDLKVGDILKINEGGYLAKAGDENGPQFQVVKVYTMPDGQPAVKVMRIK